MSDLTSRSLTMIAHDTVTVYFLVNSPERAKTFTVHLHPYAWAQINRDLTPTDIYACCF
jgi:hypothetical protein